ncbi:MAG: aminoglycoside phosphotransferase family protein [Planctomycetota bacterium]
MEQPDHPARSAAQDITRHFLGHRNASVNPTPHQGSVNWCFVIEASDCTLILRINRVRNADRALSEYRKEQWCIGQARAARVPSPQVLACGKHAGRAWSIQQHIHGTSPDQAVPRPELWRLLGQWSATIAKITPPTDHTLGITLHRAQQHTREQTQYNLEQLTPDDPLVELGVYARPDQPRLRLAFEALQDKPFEFALHHGDLSTNNVLIDADNQPWLIDWGEALVAPSPHFGINVIRKQQYLDEPVHDADYQAFLDGTGVARDELEQITPDLDRMLLLQACDLTRWAIDCCPPRLDEIAGTGRALLAAILHPQ